MIKVTDLWKQYGHLQVLKGLSLEVFKGETLVILGRSGVGKSVLLKQILGIETPDSGRVEIDQHDITQLSEKDRFVFTKNIGMLFQGSALFDSMNIYENVAFYLREHGDLASKGKALSEQELSQRVTEALGMVGLDGIQEKMPSELSGGMKKRAALARIIVYRPSILLYDEPTTGLDPITAMQINEMILKIQKDLKATSIVVTHDIQSALKVGDRLALHHDGKIVHVAAKEAFFQIEDPVIQRFYHNALPQVAAA